MAGYTKPHNGNRAYSESKTIVSGLFFLSGFLFLDPLTDRLHFPVIQIQESDADSFRTGAFGRIESRPSHFTRATDLGFIIGENEFDREPLAGMERAFG